MAEVKVLVSGGHEDTDEGLKIGSTTTLIKTDQNIIVDPGALIDEQKLLDALKKENISPEDIKLVVLTHTHIDHTVNLHLFKNATVYLKFMGSYPGQMQVINKGLLIRKDLLEDTKIAKDVKIILIPGHSNDLIGLVIDTDEGNVVIASDAISNEGCADLKNEPNPMIVADVDQYNESRKKILKIADFIIPGHGKMFKVNK
ncbi:MAG: MBL fold metallo-hydrolase [Nanoarchaeota archaeon]|nr:MBL fold metallo-hydrolase [Nanoarchaeota archaeon]